MSWKQIVKESDNSLIRVYNYTNQHMTVSFFKPEELPPVARHEDIVDPPSSQHVWDGDNWMVDIGEYKANALEVVKGAAKEKLADFDNTLIKSDFITALAPLKTQFNSAVDYLAVDAVKINALGVIEAL